MLNIIQHYMHYIILIVLILLPIVARRTSNQWSKKTLAILAYIFGFGGWVWWTISLIYWHTSVEPTLDGSEGSGAGFGFVLAHFALPILALVSTFYSLLLSSMLERPLKFNYTDEYQHNKSNETQ